MEGENQIMFDPSLIGLESTNSDNGILVEEVNNNALEDDFLSKTNVDNEDINKEKEDDPQFTINDTNKDSSDFSVVLGQELLEAGVLSKFDKEAISKIVQEEGDAAAIREMFKGHAETLKEEIKTGYDNGYNEYIQLLNGGMPKEEAVGLIQIEKFYNSIENVDLTSEDDYSVAARKDALMLNYRLTTKWSEDKINTYVNKLYDNGEDIEELKEALPNIKEYISSEKQNAKNRAIELEQENRRYIDEQNNKIKSTIKGINEVFKGDQITDLTKTKMEQALFTPVKMKDGSFTNQLWAKRNENPIDFDVKMAYLFSLGIFDDKPVEKFTNSERTKQVSKLQNFLNDNKGRSFSASIGKSFSKNDSKSNGLDEALFGF